MTGDGERLERVRARFWPAGGVRILMIGESPPPGRGFFYTGDSTLFHHTAEVMAAECRFPTDRDLFLRRFAAQGFFLADLSPDRGDKPHKRPDDDDVLEATRRLAGLVTEEHPQFVVGVLREIRDLVRSVVEQSRYPDTPWRCLPFPYYRSTAAQESFRRGLQEVLVEFGCGEGEVVVGSQN
jgi:hypothetical protein